MEIAPDQIATCDATLPSAALGYDPFGDLFNGELELSYTMPTPPVWSLEEVGRTYDDALHVHSNGQITDGLYPPEYYEYDALQIYSWDEGLETIESFDWLGTGKSEQTQDAQNNGLPATDASVRLRGVSFDAENDESNIQQESLRASPQPENGHLASHTSILELERISHSFVAPSSPPPIPSPLLGSPRLLNAIRASLGEELDVESEEIAVNPVAALKSPPSSDEVKDNLTEQEEHVSTVQDTQGLEPVAAVLPSTSNTTDSAATIGNYDQPYEDSSPAKGIAPRQSRWEGVMSRDFNSAGSLAHLHTPYAPNPGQTFAPTAAFDAHQAMLSLATAPTLHYERQPIAQSTTGNVPTRMIGREEPAQGSAVRNESPLGHVLVARSQPAPLICSANSTGDDNINNQGPAQLSIITPLHSTLCQEAVLPSITINHQAGQQWQDQLEAAAGHLPGHASSASVLEEHHKHDDDMRQDSLVVPLTAASLDFQPLMSGTVPEQQFPVLPELPPLPLKSRANSLNSVDSHNVSNSNNLTEHNVGEGYQQRDMTAIEQELSMQTSIEVEQTPPTSAKDLSPSPMVVDAEATAQSPPTNQSRPGNTRKRSKAAKKPEDISSCEEDAPAKKKPKRTTRAGSRASTAARKVGVLSEESAVERVQPSIPKSVTIELAEDEQTTQTATQPTFKVPNYTPRPARNSATVIECEMGYRSSLPSSPGFHQAHSEDVAAQEGHFSDVERSVSPSEQPVLNNSKKPPGTLSRELRNLLDDIPLEKEGVQAEDTVVPGPHLALHLQLPGRRAKKAPVEKLAKTSKIVPAFIIVEKDADGDEEELVDATPSPTASIIPKKRPRAATKSNASAPKRAAAGRKKAKKFTTPAPPVVKEKDAAEADEPDESNIFPAPKKPAPNRKKVHNSTTPFPLVVKNDVGDEYEAEVEAKAEDSNENNYFPEPKVSSPSPPPTAPAHMPPLNFKKTVTTASQTHHPLYPGYGKRTTRSDSRSAKASSTNSVVDSEDKDSEKAYSESKNDAEESEPSDVETKKKPVRKPAKTPAKQKAKNPSASAAKSRASMSVAPATPAGTNKYGFKASPARKPAAVKDKAPRAKAQPKKTAKKGGAAAAAAAATEVNGGGAGRQTRRASLAASELREAEEKAANVKLRLRSRGGGE